MKGTKRLEGKRTAAVPRMQAHIMLQGELADARHQVNPHIVAESERVTSSVKLHLL